MLTVRDQLWHFIIGALAQAISLRRGHLLSKADATGSSSDYKNAKSRASASCWCEESTDALLRYAEAEAGAILGRYWCAVVALVDALLTNKIIEGQEQIDSIILKAIVLDERLIRRAEQRRMIEAARRSRCLPWAYRGIDPQPKVMQAAV